MNTVEGHPGFLALLDKMRQTHLAKSADYGTGQDPLANLRASADVGIAPGLGAWLRAKDKTFRIDSFFKRGVLANETVEDSLIDLAAYCLLVVVLMREAVTRQGEARAGEEHLPAQAVAHAAPDKNQDRVAREQSKLFTEGPQPGQEFRHYKGGLYKVTGRAVIENTMEPCVIYESYAFGYRWVRTLADWSATVRLPDGSEVQRFRLVLNPTGGNATSKKKKLTGLFRNQPGTPEGKYLVKRRDGTVPEWPSFVLGGADLHAAVALRAYADSCATDQDIDPGFVEAVRGWADEYDLYRETHGRGDPGFGPHRTDDLATVEEMKKGLSA